MSTATLTSLAILKVTLEQEGDYLDYLRPFILQVLSAHSSNEPVSDVTVSLQIREQFGLEIPRRIVQIILGRFAKLEYIKRAGGVFWISERLPDPQLAPKQEEAIRHIEAVVRGLIVFSQEKTGSPIAGEEHAVNAICSFLSEFNISCLRAYLRGTAIPRVEGRRPTDIVLVSDYVQEIRHGDPERFGSLLVLLQGHMLANALMCPDLQSAASDYGDVTFYFDTPLLIQRLGCEGGAKESAARELIALVRKLKGKIAAFSHSRDELQNVLKGAAAYLESPYGRGGIILEARKNGTSKSDLLLLAAMVDDKLSEAGIEVENTPRYIEPLQIGQSIFEQVLENEVKYYLNPRAKDYDVNSVRSIYVLREGFSASTLENARAVFVTSNTAFARAAWEYGQNHESSLDVSSVITDFSLANIAWLKSPVEAPDLPISRLLAFSYAALQPSSELLHKFLQEIDKLETEGAFSERALQVLRSENSLVYSELMHLTLGEDSSLTGATTREIFERVSKEIRTEESEKLTLEQEAHGETQEALDTVRRRNEQLISNIRQQSLRKAKLGAWAFSGTVIFLLTAGALWASFGRQNSPFSWAFGACLIAYILLRLVNLVTGLKVVDIHPWVENRLLKWHLRKDAERFGIRLEDLNMNLEELTL